MSQVEIAVQEPTAGVVPADDAGITGLVRLALEQKADVGVLERLVALQERITDRNARAAFFEAVSDFQEACPPIPKSKTADIVSKRTGGKFSYSYAPLDVIAKTIRPTLRRCGLSYSWTVSEGEKCMEVTCVLRHIDGHEERASFPVPVESNERMSAAQSNGAALTYGKRQSLTSVLGLSTTDDDTDAPRETVRTITKAQVADLDAMIDEVGADRAKFLTYMGVGKLDEITISNMPRAIKALEAKRRA